MKKKIIIALSFLFLVDAVFGQIDSSFKIIKTIKGDIVAFTVDNLDNIYLLSSTNQVKKLNSNGDSVAVYNNVKRYGQATLIDVSNPLKVLLYYRDFTTIVVLDRFLNTVNTIDLRKQNILQVRAIGQSYDNKVWVYDELDNKLKKIDDDGKVLQETPDFRQLFDLAPTPQKIFDQDKYVYLYDSTKAIFVFDYYGTLKNRIQIAGWNNFRVMGRYIFGTKDRKLFRYDLRSLRTDEWAVPTEFLASRAFSFSSFRLYALKKDALEVYSFENK